MLTLEQSLKGLFDAENKLRSREGITNPAFMSEQMMRMSQFLGSVEETLAGYEQDLELNYALELKRRLMPATIGTKPMPVTAAEREVNILTAEQKGQVKYLTRLVKSGWSQVGVIQSRINHLVREAGIGV